MSTQCVLFDLRQAGALRLAEGPLARVCGLPVLVRTMLALAHAGYESGRVLVAPEGREALERTLLRHPNACAALDVSVEVGEGGDLPDPEDPVEGTMLYWPGSLTFGRLVPDLALAAPDPGEGITAEDPADGPATGLLLLSQEVWASAAGKSAENVRRDLEAKGKLRTMDLEHEPRWIQERAHVRAAEAALLRSLRKPEDGVVANYDRYISLFISKRLMKLPVHPNMATAAAGLTGILCGVLAAQGGYWYLLAGALLFQFNSILDGIDGEIARSKFLMSDTGQWLDTICDDASNLAFGVGAAVGCYNTYGSQVYLWLAGVIAVGVIMTVVQQYHYLITVAHSGDLNQFKQPWERSAGTEDRPPEDAEPQGPMAKFLARFEWLGRRDAFIFMFTLTALVGHIWIMVWLFALFATVAWTSILAYTVVPGLKPRARGGGKENHG